MLNGGVYGVWMEDIGAKITSLKDHSRFGDCAVVRTADKGNVCVVGGLKNTSVILMSLQAGLKYTNMVKA